MIWLQHINDNDEWPHTTYFYALNCIEFVATIKVLISKACQIVCIFYWLSVFVCLVYGNVFFFGGGVVFLVARGFQIGDSEIFPRFPCSDSFIYGHSLFHPVLWIRSFKMHALGEAMIWPAIHRTGLT